MAIYYFDSSALIKYFVTEPGSTWVRQLADTRDPTTNEYEHVISVAEITRVEVAAGLAIIERIGRIRRKVREREYLRVIYQFATRYAILGMTTSDYEKASDLTQHYPLKAFDAIQVSRDQTLNTAARAEGLSVDDPFSHIDPSAQS